MSNFDPNAILRGMQLTFVGAHRALQNPNLFKHEHYRQAALAVALGIAIQMIVSLPVLFAKASLWFLDLFTNLEAATWDDQIVDSLHFIQHSVLQVPLFLMTLMKYISPALDNMFMESLDWVDRTYIAKHKSDDPSGLRAMYYPNLVQYKGHRDPNAAPQKKSAVDGLTVFLKRSARKAGLSLTILLLSYTPYVGKFVLPAVSFYYFKSAVGIKPAVAVFACGIVAPRKYVVRFLQAYFSSRGLMRELLEPYFSRVPFKSDQRRRWFFDREGVLFGFGVAFFMMVKIPLVGVLVYGIAEASTAYLVTKITDPPPPASERHSFAESQVTWKNKNKFLTLPLANLDDHNVDSGQSDVVGSLPDVPRKKFT